MATRGDRGVVYEPIRSGYVLIRCDHLANVTSLEDERWKRTQPFLEATGWP